MGKTAHLPPAWDAAIASWAGWLRDTGKSGATVKLRRGHMRTVASASRTARPDQLTSDAIVMMADRQQWAFQYRRDLRTSLASFFEWALRTGLTQFDPVAKTPKDLIGSKLLQVRLNPAELTALHKVAEHRGLPMSTVVREEILRLLAQNIGYEHV